ncbi:MAG: response regulator [Dehalococcoidia bacterium]
MAKVMIVDDAAFVRMKCSKMLTDNGYEVAQAANGTEALGKYKEVRPDLVLLDITMPEMDGLTTLKELIKMDSDVKVAMVTAMGQQSIVMDAIKAGAKDFVVKPFDPNRVLATVEKLLGGNGNG